MKVITVARKPVVGSVAKNVLKHGTGGLNIDACRIGNFQNTQPSGMDRMNATLAEQGYRPNAYQQGEPPVSEAVGRWPANVILQHKSGCQQVGTVEGDGYVINRWDDGAKPFGDGAGHPFSSEPQTEQVAVWACAEDCPVRELDRQSGTVKSSGPLGVELTDTNARSSFNSSTAGINRTYYGDVGGASRYFHQVGGSVRAPQEVPNAMGD